MPAIDQQDRVNVNVLSPAELFRNSVRYQIPQFQRRYIWNEEKHWKPLWADVRRTAESCLDDLDNSVPPHFLGAVVLQHQPSSTGQIETRLVVDGQQRLTTLQLLLDAAQKVLDARGIQNPAELSNLIRNQEIPGSSDPNHVFKVWPTVIDHGAFREALTADGSNYTDSPIAKAHQFFGRRIEDWLDEDPDNHLERVRALVEALLHLLHMVVIDLNSTDNPHVIFESLNARGEALLESDLIKNMVMYEAERAGIVEGTRNADWLWDFNDRWWVTEIGRGRTKQPRIDIFLNHWLIMRTGNDVTTDEVFSTFRRYYTDEAKQPIQTIARDIKKISETYKYLEIEQIPDILEASRHVKEFLYRRRVMQAGVLMPVLLWLFSASIPVPQLTKALKAIESHLIRRMICLRSTTGHNRLFIGLVRMLKESDAAAAGDTVVRYLCDQESNVGLWPTDDELKNAFVNTPLYTRLTQGRLRLVLEGIEQGLRTKFAESEFPPHNLTIEHLMPQDWSDNYPLQIGSDPEERDRIIHTLGNLTLVTRPLNSTMSNAPWIGKKEELKDHSTLFLNKDLVNDTERVIWDEIAIEDRAHELYLAATKVWPHANDL